MPENKAARWGRALTAHSPNSRETKPSGTGMGAEWAGSCVCTRQGAGGCGINGLGAAREKICLWSGKKKKNHFSSEGVSFLCNSPSCSSCPHSRDFQQEISLPAWKISNPSSSGSVPPRTNTVIWGTGSSGDSGPHILEQELPDVGNSPVSPHSPQ